MLEFAARFGVSEMTSRRDSRKSAKGGQVIWRSRVLDSPSSAGITKYPCCYFFTAGIGRAARMPIYSRGTDRRNLFKNIDLLITDRGILTEDLEHLRRMTEVMVAE
jgi:hypothetical protein